MQTNTDNKLNSSCKQRHNCITHVMQSQHQNLEHVQQRIFCYIRNLCEVTKLRAALRSVVHMWGEALGREMWVNRIFNSYEI